MKKFPDIPLVWLAVFLALNWAAVRWVPGVLDFPLLTLVGYGIVAVGVFLIGWSAVWFRLRRTSIEPHDTPKSLIVEGPYQLSRNPIYLGMAAILAGAVVAGGHVLGLLPVALFVVVINRRFIAFEEDTLRATFGAEAEAYLQSTRRWL
ncbi:methyltransferase family protein [Litoreibacter arenae]|uniref:Isoprenylcysteine carboxyl methyltransferase family protein n=1 Tax=Litoreibacter arenae DSM 19593 TaxID=1123360 RepID=S9QP23_9RHOB|nr:isoprenylcysteine carboxylmethyltransferase family protein [Litoreibacter arenae]EPX81353.1 isoprenylcysteine carboxyl methyltransferase family protein [Litoreibacter arenae DSM 19593]